MPENPTAIGSTVKKTDTGLLIVELPSSAKSETATADELFNIGQHLKHQKGISEVRSTGFSALDKDVARIALAIKFSQLPKHIKFRAIVEGWDQQRVVREIY